MHQDSLDDAADSARRAPVPGVLVLGMHRSGTSVVTGIMERLGFHGGPRDSMIAPDANNSDGYWEQGPLVAWHDELLAELGGWASAPPVLEPHAVVAAAAHLPSVVERIPTMFTSPWFLKDPRQCLLLPAWDAEHGHRDLAVVVAREPAGVIDSLVRRNNYSRGLASALWERYNRELLANVAGRTAVVVRYDQLLADPRAVVEQLAAATAGLGPVADAAAIEHAAALVQARRELAPPSSDHPLWQRLVDLTGGHEALDPGALPPLDPLATRLIDRRRRRLNLLRRVFGTRSSRLGAVDQIPAKMRDALARRR